MSNHTPEPSKTYIGMQEVVDIEFNGDFATYTLASSRKDTVTADQLIAMSSPEPYPDGEISIRKWKPFVDKVMDLMMENDLEMMDKDFVLGQIESRLVNAANQGTQKLWGIDSMHHLSLRKIDEVLKSE